MTGSRYRFRPHWVPTILTLLLLPGLLALGFWQLDRAETKRTLRERRDAAAEAQPITLSVPLRPLDALLLKPVRATGSFDTERQYLLANQARDGVSGYRILTPFRFRGSDTAVLMARAWVAASGDRRELPDLDPAPSGERTIAGIATDGPSVGYRMGSAYVGDGDWPRQVTYLDFEAMDEALPYRLAPLVIEPDVSRDERLARLMGGVTPTRHTGYAVQWFALAAALVVIYIVVNLRREGGNGA